MNSSILNENLAQQFSRQISLSGFGEAGQKRLLNSRIAIVGAGGLGSPAALYLTAAGVKYISIIDGDSVELSNLHRQTLFSKTDIGFNKATVAARILEGKDSLLEINPVSEFLNVKNASKLLANHDLILDGTDNFSTKYLLNDVSLNLKIPLLSASIQGYQLQIGLFNRGSSASYRCLFPEPPESAPNCAENGILGPVAGVAGCIQACEAIKCLANIEPLDGKLLLYNLLSHQTKKITIQRNESLIGSTRIMEQSYYDMLTPDSLDPGNIISANSLKSMIEGSEDLVLIDVRSQEEHNSSDIIGGQLICKEEFIQNSKKILSGYDTKTKIVLYCASGQRSASVVAKLVRDGTSHRVFSLEGGLNSY